MAGPYDELVAELDHAADMFGARKVIIWCLEWAIARNPELAETPAGRLSIFSCRRDDVDESGGVADELSPAGES